MSIEMAVDLIKQLLTVSMLLLAPILGVAIVVGLLVSLFQSVTSIQEQTLTFVPKLIAVGAVILVSSHWMIRTLMEFCTQMIQRFPQMVG